MVDPREWLRTTELDPTALAAMRGRIAADNAQKIPLILRSHEGTPTHPLPIPSSPDSASLEGTLRNRRSHRHFSDAFPNREQLARILWFAHGIVTDRCQGPTPSAGGLQSLELYLATWNPTWLPQGCFHYDRIGHHLSQIGPGSDRSQWQTWVPSLESTNGGAGLFIVIGDLSRITERYGSRGARMLLLEAGHLMQNLCLICASIDWAVLPLGLYEEDPLRRQLCLESNEHPLYLGLLGQPSREIAN